MKKRILSVALATALAFSSFGAVFAETEYDGIKPLKIAETVLDNLNEDASANIFDKDLHSQQLSAIAAMNDAFDEKAQDADWSAYINKVYTERKTTYAENYLKVLALADAAPSGEIAADLAAVDSTYNTEGLGLKESFDKLEGFKSAMATVFSDNKAEMDAYVLTEEKIAEYVLLPTKLIFNAIFSEKGAGTTDSDYLEYNYVNSWLGNDRAKKLLAVLFGESLTKELSSTDSDAEGVVAAVKSYIKTSEGLGSVKAQLSDILVADKADAVEATYKLIGSIVSAAYEGKPVYDDIVMLFGDGEADGAFEIAMKLIDSEYDVANIWLNLMLSEFVQLNLVSGALNTVSASGAVAVSLKNNSSVTFKAEGLEEYGIGATDLALSHSWFAVVCYVDGKISDNVTYSDGKINVKRDPKKASTYDAHLVIYRRAVSDDAANFIESYPVVVSNKAEGHSPGSSGGGISSGTRFVVKYYTADGKLVSDSYIKGAILDLSRVPTRPGYIFNGWYFDKELTQKAEPIEITGPITLYAAWTKIGSAVVSKVQVPELLNGDDHFAYVQGYPDGSVRPSANITRAEIATIIFRLLKNEIRDEYATEENAFVDVNSDNWYNTAVSTLSALGIVQGRTETEFMPDEYITRAELSTIFARMADYEYSESTTLSDIAGHWAEDNIREAAAYGWIAGYEDGSFRPDNRITRAEAMTLINRVLKRIPENNEDLLEGMNKWNDNSDDSAWYYIAVQEATNSHKYEAKNDDYEKWAELTENIDWTKYE